MLLLEWMCGPLLPGNSSCFVTHFCLGINGANSSPIWSNWTQGFERGNRRSSEYLRVQAHRAWEKCLIIIINNNKLQLGCPPVAVVVLCVYKIWNWLLLNFSREGYMRSTEWQLGMLGTVSAFVYRHRETKKNLCRGDRSFGRTREQINRKMGKNTREETSCWYLPHIKRKVKPRKTKLADGVITPRREERCI